MKNMTVGSFLDLTRHGQGAGQTPGLVGIELRVPRVRKHKADNAWLRKLRTREGCSRLPKVMRLVCKVSSKVDDAAIFAKTEAGVEGPAEPLSTEFSTTHASVRARLLDRALAHAHPAYPPAHRDARRVGSHVQPVCQKRYKLHTPSACFKSGIHVLPHVHTYALRCAGPSFCHRDLCG